MKDESEVSRRDFLKRAAAVTSRCRLAQGGAAPAGPPAILTISKPNEVVNYGIIGTGIGDDVLFSQAFGQSAAQPDHQHGIRFSRGGPPRAPGAASPRAASDCASAFLVPMPVTITAKRC